MVVIQGESVGAGDGWTERRNEEADLFAVVLNERKRKRETEEGPEEGRGREGGRRC